MLRTDFALPTGRTVTSALLHFIGLGRARVLVNSVDILGATFYEPAQTDWRKRLLYATVTVDPEILRASAANAIGVILGNGMYNVPEPSAGRYTKWVGSFGPRQLLLALVVNLDDGSNITIASGASSGDGTVGDGSSRHSISGSNWTATDGGPITFSHEYAGEDWVGELDVPGWAAPGFDPRANPLVAWAPAADCTASAPAGVLEPATVEAVAVVEVLPALNWTVPAATPGTVLVDVGRNFAGTAAVDVAGVAAGATVRVWPSETVVDGTIQQASGGTPVYWQHTVAVNGSLTLAPVFATYGWRWLAVKLLPPQSSAVAQTIDAAASDNGTITVLAATYGGNCGASAGDATAAVTAWCGVAARKCAYQICVCGDNTCSSGAPPCLPDPAQNCAKDFSVVWRCTSDPAGSNRSTYLPAEADNGVAALGCGPPPPPPPTPNVTAARGRFVRAAAPTVGSWSCADPWVNRIHAITLEAIAANLQHVLTDCPHRERLGWLEVSHLMFPSIAYNFDIRNLWAKISRDTVDSQQADGMVPDIAPEYTVFSGAFRDSPEWGSAAVLNPAWLLQWYGDSATTAATYATAARYVDYLLGKREASGLLTYGLGDWIPVVASPAGVTATGVLYQDLQAMATMAAALGRPADAANYTALAAEVAAAYSAAFAGAWPTQAAAGIALTLGMPLTNASAAAEYIVADIRARGNVTTAGEIGNRYALLALADAPGGTDAVWASLQRRDAPGYGWMLSRGETALAESWTDSPGDSHIHAMYGHIDEYLYAHVAGIRQAVGSVAWRAVVIAPQLPGSLAWVNATFSSPRGLIHAAAVDVGGGVVELTVEVPPGVVAEVVLPRSGARVHISAGMRHVLRDSSTR